MAVGNGDDSRTGQIKREIRLCERRLGELLSKSIDGDKAFEMSDVVSKLSRLREDLDSIDASKIPPKKRLN